MPTLNTGSDLIEVNFTHEELNTAMQLKDTALSQMYLGNLRVDTFRQMISIDFNEAGVGVDEIKLRQHAFLKGQLELLDTLIRGILNPAPIPVNTGEANSQQ